MTTKIVGTEDVRKAIAWATQTGRITLYKEPRAERPGLPTEVLRLANLLHAYFKDELEDSNVDAVTGFSWKRTKGEEAYSLLNCDFRGILLRGDFSNCNFNYPQLLSISQVGRGEAECVLPSRGRFSRLSDRGNEEDWAAPLLTLRKKLVEQQSQLGAAIRNEKSRARQQVMLASYLASGSVSPPQLVPQESVSEGPARQKRPHEASAPQQQAAKVVTLSTGSRRAWQQVTQARELLVEHSPLAPLPEPIQQAPLGQSVIPVPTQRRRDDLPGSSERFDRRTHQGKLQASAEKLGIREGIYAFFGTQSPTTVGAFPVAASTSPQPR